MTNEEFVEILKKKEKETEHLLFHLRHLIDVYTGKDEANNVFDPPKEKPNTTKANFMRRNKLNRRQVATIKMELAKGTPPVALAQQFKVTSTTIYNIKGGNHLEICGTCNQTTGRNISIPKSLKDEKMMI